MKAMSQKTDGIVASEKFDVARVRQDFPILSQKIHGKPLVYLDNGATSQKPQCVIDAIDHYYRAENSNIHRGVHHLSEQATAAYEAARGKTARFYQRRGRIGRLSSCAAPPKRSIWWRRVTAGRS